MDDAGLYEHIGITLTARVETDYGPTFAEEVTLHRCKKCGALVDGGTWQSGMDTHTEWHVKVDGRAIASPVRK